MKGYSILDLAQVQSVLPFEWYKVVNRERSAGPGYARSAAEPVLEER